MLFCVHTTGHFEANNDFVGGQELSTFVLLISSLLASIVKQLESKGAIYGEVQYFYSRQQLENFPCVMFIIELTC